VVFQKIQLYVNYFLKVITSIFWLLSSDAAAVTGEARPWFKTSLCRPRSDMGVPTTRSLAAISLPKIVTSFNWHAKKFMAIFNESVTRETRATIRIPPAHKCHEVNPTAFLRLVIGPAATYAQIAY
jgi:hypothetical protein